MKFILLLSLMVMLLVGGTTFAGVGDPDPTGIEDTLDLVVTIDWGNNTVEAEAYCFTDDLVSGSTVGFSWGNSTATLVMDSAVPTALMTTGYGALGTFIFLYEGNSIATTNANERFSLGGFTFGSGIPGEANRRLWATYYFTMTWTTDDCVIFDTLTYDGGSTNLYTVAAGGYSILYKAPFVECNPPSGINVIPGDVLPETFALSQNYPNPFNPTTEINFDIPTRSHTTLRVYNILGQEVETLVDEEMPAGRYVAEWDASNYSSGVYFYKISSDDFIDTKKMVLIK